MSTRRINIFCLAQKTDEFVGPKICLYRLRFSDCHLTLILSEMEEVRDLRGSRVFSSRKLESSKLDPRLESEQEMHRDLRLAEKNI